MGGERGIRVTGWCPLVNGSEICGHKVEIYVAKVDHKRQQMDFGGDAASKLVTGL